MQKLLLIPFLLLFFSAKCDTLDFYHVYWNDSLIAKFNTFSELKKVSLKAEDLKENDAISIRYGTDHPCPSCTTILSVFIEVMEKMPEVSGGMANFEKLSISLSDILYFRKKYGIDKFHFNYSVREEQPMYNFSCYLFELEIK